jgi:four helix bundle protein
LVLSRQLLRSGVSVGVNFAEANGGVPSVYFLVKVSIFYKEIFEAKYWLSLLKDTEYIRRKNV